MKAQHAHHIFCQFVSEYFGDSRASLMLFIEYQQARLDAAAEEIVMSSQGNTLSRIAVAYEVVEIKRPASTIMRPFHDYVGRLPRVRECIPLPRQYHNRKWILMVHSAVEGAWPMQVLGSISGAD